MADGSGPVSYTHLDVYKRQPEQLNAATDAENTARIIRLMFGETAARSAHGPARAAAEFGPVVLQVDGLRTQGGSTPLRDVSLAVRAGEILGIAGIDGNGQKAVSYTHLDVYKRQVL